MEIKGYNSNYSYIVVNKNVDVKEFASDSDAKEYYADED